MGFSILLSLCGGTFVAMIMAGEDPNYDGENFFKSAYFWITEAVFGILGIMLGSILGV